MVEVPLRARDGSIRAVALVDDCDAGAVLAHKWHLNANGYACRALVLTGRGSPGGPKWTTLRLSRVLLGVPLHDPREVDHINHDPLDNRRSNLRIVTHAQNGQNRRMGYGRSSHRGVCWHKATGKWTAYGQIGGRRVYLGLFADELEAANAVAAFRAEHMPFSAEALTA